MTNKWMMNAAETQRVAEFFQVPTPHADAIARSEFLSSELQRLTLVRAAAGYGKTSALAQWAKRQKDQGSNLVWIRGATVDRSRAWEVICNALILALLNEHPDAAACVAELPALASRPDVRAKQLVGALQHKSVIILDNYEGLTDLKLDLGLLDLVQQSENLSLIVSGRHFEILDSPLTSAALATQLVSEAELLFHRTEVKQLAAQFGGIEAAALSYLMEATGGWPLAVSALLSSSAGHRGGVPAAGLIGLADVKAHLELIADSFLRRVGNTLERRVFLMISLCPGVSDSTLSIVLSQHAQITPLKGSAELEQIKQALTRLDSLGLLSRSSSTGIDRYRSHLQVGEVFRKRAVQEFTHEELQRLWRVHADDLAGTRPFEAVVMYAELSDFPTAESVLERHLASAACADEELRDALRRIPFDHLAQYPSLASSSLVLHMLDPTRSDAQILEMVGQLHRSSIELRLAREPEAPAIAELVSLSFAYRLVGEHQLAHALALEFAAQTRGLTRQAILDRGPSLAFLHAALGFTAALSGDLEYARLAYGRALECAEILDSCSEKARAFYGLALCHGLLGEMRIAKRFARQAQQMSAEWDQPGASTLVLEVAPTLALLAAEHGDTEQMQGLREILCPLRQRLEAWPILVMAESDMYRLRGDSPRALEVLTAYQEEAPRVIPVSPFLQSKIINQTAKLYLLQGNYAAAEKQIQQLDPADPERILSSLRHALLVDSDDQARRALEQLSGVNLTSRQRCDYLLYAAVAGWRGGAKAQALDDYLRAVRIMRQVCGFTRLSLVPYDTLLELAQAAAAAGEKGLLGRVSRLPEHVRVQRFEKLSPAEQRTIEALGGLDSLEQVAAALFISFNTLKFHLRNIYRKLRVANREEAVQRAVRMGLLEETKAQSWM